MSFLLVTTAVLGLLLVISTYIHHWSKKARCVAHLPGPTPYPIIGSVHLFIMNNYDIAGSLPDLGKKYGSLCYVWLGPVLMVSFADADYLEALMSSNTYNSKGFFYNFLKPWLGSGLLTSSGHLWKRHRKILTPSFHFKILEEFLYVFNKNCDIMVRILKEKVNGPSFDIHENIALCSLDVICETAMGVRIHAQEDSESPYVKAVKTLGLIWIQRIFSPWLFLDFIFRWSSCGKRQNKCLEILHGTTKKLILERKAEYKKILEENKKNNDEEDDVGQKKRLAFLDLLLQYSLDGANISDQEICDEVDTFMFEGHDTVSAAVTFCIGLLAAHPDIQDKVYEELITMLGDSDRNLSYSELQELTYLECVIKESLRLYPSVPVFARELKTDSVINGLHLAAGTNIAINVFWLHRNPKYYPDPDKFDPSRFEAQNTQGRHPYSFLPFSAGPRNCIGQKFAMNEMKCMVSKMVRNFRIIPGAKEFRASSDMIMRCANGMIVKLENRI